MLDAYLVIGEVLKPQGVRGEIKVPPLTSDPERFYDLEQVFFKKGQDYNACEVEACRVSDEAVFLKLDGVNDRDAAEMLRGQMLYVDRENAVELSEDENFIVDLIGCIGTDTNGREIGKLVDVMQPGGNDVYIFKGALGEVLVPALRSVVLKVDVHSKTMLLDAKRLGEVAVFDEN